MDDSLEAGVHSCLVTPTLGWLGQLLVERRLPLSWLHSRLAPRERALLHSLADAESWVPLASVEALFAVLFDIHGGDPEAVCRDLGRRTAADLERSRPDLHPARASSTAGSGAHLARRLSGLLRLGEWRVLGKGMPGDLVALQSSWQVPGPILDWIGGLVTEQIRRREGRLVHIVPRIEGPGRTTFFRCAG